MEEMAKIVSHTEALAAEIGRLVASPYPVSLKALQNLVQSSKLGDLESWADQHQTQIHSLAQALLEALPMWPYVTELTQTLAALPELAHALLLESPMLLSQLLDRAIRSDADFEQVSGLCVALLAHPLPADIALPASAQPFLLRLFEYATSEPCVESIEQVYTILDGACTSLLGVLSTADLSKFQDDLTRMMRSTKRFEDQLQSMLCLLVVGKIPIPTAPPSRSGPSSPDVPPEHTADVLKSLSPQSPARFHKFFCGEAASKTMQLVALQVIYACRREADPAAAARRIQVARLIASQVEEGALSSWAVSQAQVVQKVHEKSCQAQLSASVRIEALAFSCALSSATSMPKNVLAATRKMLTDEENIAVLSKSDVKAMEYILDHVAAKLPTASLTLFIRSLISIAASGVAQGKARAGSLTHLLDMTQSHVHSCKPLRQALLETLSDKDSAEKLGRLLNFSKPDGRCGADLQISLVSLFISASLFSDTDDPSIPGSVAAQLIQTQRALMHVTGPHRQVLQRDSDQIQLPARDPERSGAGKSRFWRDQLFCELDAQSKRSHQSLVQLFGQSILDMETRCEQVEEPLRAEQAMRAKAERRTKEAQQIAAELEQKLRSSQGEVRRLGSESQAASDQVRSLQAEAENVSRETDARLASSEEQHQLKTLELETVIATQAEKIDDLDDRAKEVSEKLGQAELAVEEYKLRVEEGIDETARLSVEHTELRSHADALSAELGRVRTNIHDSEVALDEMRAEKERAVQTALEHLAHVEKLNREADEARAEHGREMADKENSVASLKRKNRQLEEDCDRKRADLEKELKTRLKLLQTLGISNTAATNPRRGSVDVSDEATTLAEIPPKRQKAQQQAFRVPRRRSVRVSGTRNQTQDPGVLREASANAQASFSTPKTQQTPSASSSSSKSPAIRRSSRRSKGGSVATSDQENKDDGWSLTDLEGIASQEFDTTTVEF